MAGSDVERFALEGGGTIAYLRRAGKSPGVLWLGGFKSEMTGRKATAFDRWAAERGRQFLRFDYSGHGQSSGDFRMGTISHWEKDMLAVLDGLAEGPQILAGSSMGGWLALLAALARPERVKGLLLIAPATDFTEAVLWARMPTVARAEIMEKGEWSWPTTYDAEPYPITRALIEDGRRHLLLGGPIRLSCPVRIVQGMQDPDIPWQHALTLVDRIEGDARLTLIKHGDHLLSAPEHLAAAIRVLDELIEETA